MPYRLKYKLMHMVDALDTSIVQYRMLIEELLQSGVLSKSEADKRLANYRARLCAECNLITEFPLPIGIEASALRDLIDSIVDIENWADLQSSNNTDSEAGDALIYYLRRKKLTAMESLERAMNKAREMFAGMGKLAVSNHEQIEIDTVEQLSRKSHKQKISCWYWGKTPVNYDQTFVDEVERSTNCQCTIFQRIPEGFLRISTNIRNAHGKRAVGTYIANESEVAKSILKGETYQGSAFVLNDWYLSIYEPIKVDGEVAGILYLGRKESNVLIPNRYFSEGKMQGIFERLKNIGALRSNSADDGSGALVAALGQMAEMALHPVINLGLKEISARLIQEKYKHSVPSNLRRNPDFNQINEYIKNHLMEPITADLLADHLDMSKASLYRYF